MPRVNRAPAATSGAIVRRLAALAAPAAILAAHGCKDAPARVPARYTIDDFYASSTYAAGSFSPDGKKILFSTNAGGVMNAATVSVDGGAPVALTTSTTNAIWAISYFPNDERVLFTSDEGGNELTHVFVREVDGRVTDVTPGGKVKGTFVGWADGDTVFCVATNERDARFFDLYAYNVNGYARTMVYKNTDGLEIRTVSRDGRWIALVKARTADDSDIWLFDRRAGTARKVTNHRGDARIEPDDFSPDGQFMMFRTNANRDFTMLRSLNTVTFRRDSVYFPIWDVTSATYGRTGGLLVATVNEDARTVPVLFDVGARFEIPLGVVDSALTYSGVRISPDEKDVAFFSTNGSAPPDLFTGSVAGPFRRVLSGLAPKIDRADLVPPRAIRFKSFDTEEVAGLLYMPLTAKPEHKVPGLVLVHDGPGGQSVVGYSPLMQYLVNHEYAVYAVNVRGSEGYGKRFHGLDDRRHGEGDLRDVVESRRVLVESQEVDSTRIGIIGSGYGGFMVLAALAFKPDSFRVGVDLFGVANWIRSLKSIPRWWEAERAELYAEMGDPTVDSLRLFGISPIFHTSNMRNPLMVLQGANDPRVLAIESQEIVAAVRKNKTPVEYVVFPDEGHGFARKVNEKKGYAQILAFLDKYLKAPATRP